MRVPGGGAAGVTPALGQSQNGGRSSSSRELVGGMSVIWLMSTLSAVHRRD
ncbi:hypothetical protein Q760_13435 [Cellulomonas cellasea DSM 20118]|uniref:Uncharacterized protein n=1 Tax=Cellulomonas cellasea DSM 20118 TaxID=1408250 RepID=A0A0A0B6J1_9CELL|nr:hypothetical protein Q760_13435 [Cellulomonas cellasea DSM 20118]